MCETIKFSLNYTKLATLAIKAYVRKSKINLAKKKSYLEWGLNLKPVVNPYATLAIITTIEYQFKLMVGILAHRPIGVIGVFL